MVTETLRDRIARIIAEEANQNAYGIVECECCQERLADRILAELGIRETIGEPT